LTAKEWELITPYTVEVTCVIHMNNHIGTEEFVDFTYPGNGSFSVELCSAIAKLYAETYDIHYPVSSVLCAFNEATSKFQIKLNTRIWHRYGYRS
jgi:hypothetical protein